jgi:hypothetical protein
VDYSEGVSRESGIATGQANEIQKQVDAMNQFDSQIFGMADQYQSQVNPGNFQLPSTVLSTMMWISNTASSMFDQLGDFKVMLYFPMLIGLLMLLVGRGAHVFNANSMKSRKVESKKEGDP